MLPKKKDQQQEKEQDSDNDEDEVQAEQNVLVVENNVVKDVQDTNV